MIAWILVAGVGLVIVCLASGWWRERAARLEWEALLSPAAEGAVTDTQVQLNAESAMLESWHEGALEARGRADVREAIRCLTLAYGVVDAALPDRLRRLRGMAQLARKVVAIVPTPPVPAGAFRLRELVTVAGLGQALHHLLVGPGERFLLRLYVLGWCGRLTWRALGRASRSAAVAPEATAAWAAFEAAVPDWRTIGTEEIVSLRALLTSMAVAQADLERTTVPHGQ